MKQFIKSLLDRRQLYRIVETNKRGEEMKSLYYIYKTNINFLPITRLYIVIKDGEHYIKYGKRDLNYGNSTYRFPSGLNSYLSSDWLDLDSIVAPNALKEIAVASLDTLAAEIVKIVQFDIKIQDELILANDVERKLLKEKQAGLWSEYYQPFHATLGNLFIRLEKERDVLTGRNLLSSTQKINDDVSLLLNTEISTEYQDRQIKVNNLLASFKELD